MSNAVAVQHGAFGRAAVYCLDRPISLHAHREGHLVFHLDGPPAAVRIDGEAVPLTPADAAAVSPWEPHVFEAPEGGAGLYLVLYVKPVWFLQAGRSARSALSFGRRRIAVADRVAELAPLVASLLLSADPPELLDDWLYELVRVCFDQSWQWAPETAPVMQAGRLFTDFRIRRALKLMQEKLRDPDGIDGVARESGLSRPHFYKLFRRQMGITPNLYMNTLRTERAIGDLLGGGRTVTDIGHDLGFASQASFTRFFISNVGIAPSEYRRVAAPTLH